MTAACSNTSFPVTVFPAGGFGGDRQNWTSHRYICTDPIAVPEDAKQCLPHRWWTAFAAGKNHHFVLESRDLSFVCVPVRAAKVEVGGQPGMLGLTFYQSETRSLFWLIIVSPRLAGLGIS